MIYDSSYVKVAAYHITETRTEIGSNTKTVNKRDLTLEKCNDRYYEPLGKELALSLLTDRFYWIKETDIKIGGNFASLEYNYIKWVFQKCTGDPSCQDISTINSALDQLHIGFGISDYYFDSKDYIDPIKVNLASNFEISILSDFTKEMFINIRKNEAIDYTRPWSFSNPVEYNYFSVGSESVDMFVPTDDVFASVIFALDSESLSLERKVFSISDLLAMLGGMKEILMMIGGFFVGMFQNQIYLGSLMNKLYLVDNGQRKFTFQGQSRKFNDRSSSIRIEEEKETPKDSSIVSSQEVLSDKIQSNSTNHEAKFKEIKESLVDKISSLKQFRLTLKDVGYMTFCFPKIKCK